MEDKELIIRLAEARLDMERNNAGARAKHAALTMRERMELRSKGLSIDGYKVLRNGEEIARIRIAYGASKVNLCYIPSAITIVSDDGKELKVR